MRKIEHFRILLPYGVIGGLVSGLIGLAFLKGLFLAWGLIIFILINRIYTKGDDSLLVSDMLYAISLVFITGLALLLIYGICIVIPYWTACVPNLFRATTFGIVYYPLAIGSILWIALRSPMIIKALIKKR